MDAQGKFRPGENRGPRLYLSAAASASAREIADQVADIIGVGRRDEEIAMIAGAGKLLVGDDQRIGHFLHENERDQGIRFVVVAVEQDLVAFATNDHDHIDAGIGGGARYFLPADAPLTGSHRHIRTGMTADILNDLRTLFTETVEPDRA